MLQEDDGCAGDGITRIWRATDNCGNSSIATQNITVNDDQAPVLSGIGPDMTIECDETPVFSNPNASDNCDNDVTIVFADVIIDGSCEHEYAVVRTWVASDDCGNSATANQTIHLIDTTPPTFTFVPEDDEIPCDELPGVTIAIVEDNCDENVTVTYSDDEQVDQTIRTFVAVDACGNSSSATQVFTFC